MKSKILSIYENCDDERLKQRMFTRIARKYCAQNGIHNIYDPIEDVAYTPTIPEVPAMLDKINEKGLEQILKSRPFRTITIKGENMKIETQSIKEILEVKDFDEAEVLWEFCWEDLRAKEGLIDINNADEVAQFVYEVQMLNKHLLKINESKPNHMGLTRYWIKRGLLEHEICSLFGLSHNTVVLKENHIWYFLNMYKMEE